MHSRSSSCARIVIVHIWTCSVLAYSFAKRALKYYKEVLLLLLLPDLKKGKRASHLYPFVPPASQPV